MINIITIFISIKQKLDKRKKLINLTLKTKLLIKKTLLIKILIILFNKY